ncbi:MAG: helix-turn-helix domain-containing protein [Stenotrophomonas sp.]
MDIPSMSVRIKASRISAGLSQTELAVAIGVNRSTVGHWERGGAFSPSREHLQALSLALQVSLDWLVHGEPSVPASATHTAASLSPRLAAEQKMVGLSRQLPLSFVDRVLALMEGMAAYL